MFEAKPSDLSIMPLRHVRHPAIHRTAENAKGDAATAEMCRDRKSVRTCANDCCFNHSFEHEPLSVVSAAYIVPRDLPIGPSEILGRNQPSVQRLYPVL